MESTGLLPKSGTDKDDLLTSGSQTWWFNGVKHGDSLGFNMVFNPLVICYIAIAMENALKL